MIIIGRADKAVIGDVHELPQGMEAVNNLIHILLRGDALLGSLALYLLAVLIRTGQEVHVIPRKTLVACKRIGIDGAVGMPDVQLGTRVIDRGRDIKGLVFHNHFLSCIIQPKFCGISREIKTPMPGKTKHRGEKNAVPP